MKDEKTDDLDIFPKKSVEKWIEMAILGIPPPRKMHNKKNPRWWFQKILIFTPQICGISIQFDLRRCIFQMGGKKPPPRKHWTDAG